VPRGDRGQATVELVLALPLVVTLALAIVQVALVARQQVMLVHAAGEGARAAAVGEPASVVADRVRRAAGNDVAVVVRTDGDYVTVTVRAPAHTDAPLVGGLVGHHTLQAELTMWRERAG
jgi:Flp pilus assembly protein TadG